MVKLADRLMDAYTVPELLTDDAALWQFLEEAAQETNDLLWENDHFGG